MGIPKLNIFCDSAIIISWAKGIDSLNPPALSHWCRDTRRLISCFHHLSFCHIFREHNQLADRLSKSTLSLAPGCGKYSEFIDGLLASHDTFHLFWAWCRSSISFIFLLAPVWWLWSRHLLIAVLCCCVLGLLRLTELVFPCFIHGMMVWLLHC